MGCITFFVGEIDMIKPNKFINIPNAYNHQGKELIAEMCLKINWWHINGSRYIRPYMGKPIGK
jgi:hypothetical protein